MLHGEKRAPAALVELVADPEIEDRSPLVARPFNHKPEQQFSGAEFRNGFIDRTELADDVVLLARKTGYCGDDALVLAVQANGMQLQQTVCARLGNIGQVVKKSFTDWSRKTSGMPCDAKRAAFCRKKACNNSHLSCGECAITWL